MKNFYTIKEWVGGKNKNKSVPLIIEAHELHCFIAVER
jgi:hypothetical protein